MRSPDLSVAADKPAASRNRLVLVVYTSAIFVSALLLFSVQPLFTKMVLPRLGGSVVAIGNAPTALFRLLEIIAAGGPRPAAIIGMPVGFVGAAESKEALIESGLSAIVMRGRKGGSAMAAAAVNALASDIE